VLFEPKNDEKTSHLWLSAQQLPAEGAEDARGLRQDGGPAGEIRRHGAEGWYPRAAAHKTSGGSF
jgi:hypothetical protein